MKKMIMNKETKLAIYQLLKDDLINILEQIETLISEEYVYIKKILQTAQINKSF